MKRILIIGCPGSGKSTFARSLHRITNIPLVHLDLLFWNPDRTTVDREIFRKRLFSEMEKERWIIDGNYGATMEARIRACDTVFFLDYPTEICLEGIRARCGKPREDIPWVERENEVDEDFASFVKNYAVENRPKVLALLETYSSKKIFTFHSRREAALYLEKLSRESNFSEE